MKDFIDWVFDAERPMWITITAVVVVMILCLAVFVIGVTAIVRGYWLVPVILWIVAPTYFVVRAYLESKK